MLAVRETPASYPRPRLLDRVREAIRARHYSRRTEKAYVGWIKRYIFFHGKRHPVEMGGAEVSRFLTTLAVEGRVAASTQNQALNALLFLYRVVLEQDLPWLDDVVRAQRPIHLPVVLTRDEVRRVLERLDGPSRLIVLLLYGAGLRLLEAAQLRVKDVDAATNQIVIRNGKGAKDRVTMLPAAAKSELLLQVDVVRRQHFEDVRHGAGWVALPDALARKYPNAGRELGWQWIFPATRHYVDRITGQRRRHHLHESVIQRAVKKALRQAEVAKLASCHTFRHSFATHLLEDGHDIRTVQELSRPEPRPGRCAQSGRPPVRSMSADTGYMGGLERDTPVAASVLVTANSVSGQRISPLSIPARILDTLHKQRGAGCYTGLDNTS